MSRVGWLGFGLLALHVVLLSLPPIPPEVGSYMRPGGSLWSYLIGYTAVVLLLIELRRFGSAVTGGWRRIGPVRHWLAGAIAVAAALCATLALHTHAPERFARFSGEEGLWEPLTLFCYLGAAVLLWSIARDGAAADRKPMRLLAGLYLLPALEEIDYFGIFGGFFGRIDGVYAGSLHDIIRLVAEGVLTTGATVGLAAAALLALVLLWRTGYLSPQWLRAAVRAREFLWVILGLGFLSAAAIQDADLFGWAPPQPSTEEALELVGAMCVGVFALETTVREAPPRSQSLAALDWREGGTVTTPADRSEQLQDAKTTDTG